MCQFLCWALGVQQIKVVLALMEWTVYQSQRVSKQLASEFEARSNKGLYHVGVSTELERANSSGRL